MLGGTDPRATERVGDVLDEKWTLEHLIGAGGMGAVYAARHRNGARAAVKILHPQLARIDEIRERFRREGYAANRVEHRGVVQVLDDDLIKAGPDAGSAYLVMELLEGESLQDRALRDPKLGESDLLEVMDAVLDVLAAAHAHGVIHRDLKPENIFLAKDPEREGTRIKVLDFGLARISESSAVTNAGIAVGTPSYMSPEQAAGRSSEIDGRTDIFALGATIFRIVTGRRLHEVENLVQLVGLMASRPAPRLHSVHPEVSESFARIIDRALAFRRDDRYPDAAAMRDDVRAELEKAGAPTLHVIPFSVRKVPVARPDVVTAAQEEEEDAVVADSDASEELSATPPAPPRSNTLPWALVLILLAALAWQLGPSLQRELVARTSVANIWTRSEPPPPTSPAVAEVADASSEPADSGQVDADTDVDDGGAGKAEDLQLDAGESSATELSAGDAGHDGGPSHVVTAVRAHVPVPHTTKPSAPAKKPAPKKPTPAPTRDPRRR